MYIVHVGGFVRLNCPAVEHVIVLLGIPSPNAAWYIFYTGAMLLLHWHCKYDYFDRLLCVGDVKHNIHFVA